jgi:hypothetical protein
VVTLVRLVKVRTEEGTHTGRPYRSLENLKKGVRKGCICIFPIDKGEAKNRGL